MGTMKKRFIRSIISILTVTSAILFTGCNTALSNVASAFAVQESTSAVQESISQPQQSSSSSLETISDLGPIRPWVTSVLIGNLPAKVPEVKDDTYTHYCYDYIAAHQKETSLIYTSKTEELRKTVTRVINDSSRSGHDLEQLRIFFEQAKDLNTLKKIGLSEVMPYIKMVDAVDSIEKMNDLLSSEEFPFTPFINPVLGMSDTRDKMGVSIYPNLILVNAIYGVNYYAQTDDPAKREEYDSALNYYASSRLYDMALLGYGYDKLQELCKTVISFERGYGKYYSDGSHYVTSEYGAMAEAYKNSTYTLSGLSEFCPGFPLKAMLSKCRKSEADQYYVESTGWVSALNDLWTKDNLESIKTVVKAYIMNETRPYRDPSYTFSVTGQKKTAEEFAYKACSELKPVSYIVSKIYCDEAIGAEGTKRLRKVADDLEKVYVDLINDTPWIDDMSAALIREKLDHMTLNITEPVGGYPDLSGISLTPTSRGGSLISNYLKLKDYINEEESKRINGPASADIIWHIFSPTTVNAFYDPATNSINLLPGILTSVFYRKDMSDEEILAGVGWVIGHEISHGFDYSGSQIDAYGQPNPVYSDQSLSAFLEKSKRVADYLSRIEYDKGKHFDGQIMKGEMTADLSGMQACLKLLEQKENPDYEGFFKAYSMTWAQTIHPDNLAYFATNSYPLNNFRININLQMFDVIYDKLGVKEGDGMYLAPENRIVIWN